MFSELCKVKMRADTVSKNSSSPIDEISEMKTKRQMSCDSIFASYLAEVAKKVKKEYYAQVLRFVLLYRDCINTCSGKLNEDKAKLPEMLKLRMEPEMERSGLDYTQTNNAEQVPDISNDFMLRRLRNSGCELSFEDSKTLTLNLNYWLFRNRYTCSTVSLVEVKTE
jgi:hypothetical protein